VQLNDIGEVAGNYSDSTGGHVFLYRDGTYTRIDPPSSGSQSGSTYASFSDLNNVGQILGSYYGSSSGSFLYTDGVSRDVSVAGSSSSSFSGMNDLGQLIGTFYDGSGFNAVLATPDLAPAPPPCGGPSWPLAAQEVTAVAAGSVAGQGTTGSAQAGMITSLRQETNGAT